MSEGNQPTARRPVTSEPVTVPLTDRARPRRQRVLVVDDEPNVTLIIQQALKRLPDCEVVTASNGLAAWQLFQTEPFDLLITDYNMPKMNGITLAQQVRHHSPRTIIIMITAYSLPHLPDTAEGAVIQKVLNKPVSIAEIRRLTVEALRQIEAE